MRGSLVLWKDHSSVRQKGWTRKWFGDKKGYLHSHYICNHWVVGIFPLRTRCLKCSDLLFSGWRRNWRSGTVITSIKISRARRIPYAHAVKFFLRSIFTKTCTATVSRSIKPPSALYLSLNLDTQPRGHCAPFRRRSRAPSMEVLSWLFIPHIIRYAFVHSIFLSSLYASLCHAANVNEAWYPPSTSIFFSIDCTSEAGLHLYHPFTYITVACSFRLETTITRHPGLQRWFSTVYTSCWLSLTSFVRPLASMRWDNRR